MIGVLGIVLVFAYIAVGFYIFGYLSAKWGYDGPDGLVPLVGSVFWIIVIPVYYLCRTIGFIVRFGEATGRARLGKSRDATSQGDQ